MLWHACRSVILLLLGYRKLVPEISDPALPDLDLAAYLRWLLPGWWRVYFRPYLKLVASIGHEFIFVHILNLLLLLVYCYLDGSSYWRILSISTYDLSRRYSTCLIVNFLALVQSELDGHLARTTIFQLGLDSEDVRDYMMCTIDFSSVLAWMLQQCQTISAAQACEVINSFCPPARQKFSVITLEHVCWCLLRRSRRI